MTGQDLYSRQVYRIAVETSMLYTDVRQNFTFSKIRNERRLRNMCLTQDVISASRGRTLEGVRRGMNSTLTLRSGGIVYAVMSRAFIQSQ